MFLKAKKLCYTYIDIYIYTYREEFNRKRANLGRQSSRRLMEEGRGGLFVSFV